MRAAAIVLVMGMFCSVVMAADKGGAPAEPSGMVQLFNGKDLTGWDGDPRLWWVKDGVLRGETTKENAAEGQYLHHLEGTADAAEGLRPAAVLPHGRTNNSGIQYRSKHITEGKNNNWVVRGYQHELRNEKKSPNTSSFIYDEGGKRGRMCLVGEKVVWTRTARRTSSARSATRQPSSVRQAGRLERVRHHRQGQQRQALLERVQLVFHGRGPEARPDGRDPRPPTSRGKPDVGGVQGCKGEEVGLRRMRTLYFVLRSSEKALGPR